MKKILAITAFGVLLSSFAFHFQQGLRKLPEKHFKAGERFVYRAHLGFINAARAEVNLLENINIVNGRPCYQIHVDAYSAGPGSFFYNFNNVYQSFIDTTSVTTHYFRRDIQEPNYALKETITFDHTTKTGKLEQVKNGEKKPTKIFPFKPYPQDLVSGYYFLRTVDFSKVVENEIIAMNAVYEDSVYNFQLRYLGEDVVKTKFGKINAFKLSPVMPNNKLFDGGDAILLWISNDKNKVPLKLKAKMFVGAVELDLEEHGQLIEEFNFANK